MSAWRIWHQTRGVRGLAAVLTCGATLAWGGPAAAAPHHGGRAAPWPALAAGDISTVVGGVGGPARATTVSLGTCGVAFGNGHVYLAGDGVVRSVDPASDWLTNPAGVGDLIGPLGDGGRATAAILQACGVEVDRSSNLVLADMGNNLIRVVATSTGTFYGQAMTAGHIYAVAGDGSAGFSGDGGPAASAQLDQPMGVAVDGAGNLLIADRLNNRVRVVAAATATFYGRTMSAGDIYTVAGGGSGLGDGGPGTSARLNHPVGVAADAVGNLLIADTGDKRIRVVAGTSGTFYGQAMTAGDIYTVAGNGIGGFSGDGGPATSARLNGPAGVAVDGTSNLLIADNLENRVRVVAESTGTFYGQAMTAGDIYTVAGNGKRGFGGDGGVATGAPLYAPGGVTVDDTGNLVISDNSNNRVRIVAASTGTFYGKAMAAEHIYTVAGNGPLAGYCCDGGPATSAELQSPQGVTVGSSGSVMVADTFNDLVRMVAGTSGTFYGTPMAAGHIYTVAGGGSSPADGVPATSAALYQPAGVAVDTAGNLLVADTRDNLVRVVAATTGTAYGRPVTVGDIYTLAGDGTAGFSGDGGPATRAQLNGPRWVAVDGTGNLVIADTGNNRIRVVAARTGTFYGQAMTAGDIYTVAGNGTRAFSGDGGPATSAGINTPQSVAVDRAGNLVLSDTFHNRIRVVAESTGTFYGQAMTAGDIYTVAGTGDRGFFGNGGPATSAKFAFPDGVTVDAAGNLLIADSGNDEVRVVAAAAGTFYGRAMTAGNIYDVAGNHHFGFSGDGGQAILSELASPESAAVDGAGNLLIADTGSFRIREVTG